MRFRKPEAIPLLFLIGAELLLIGLGVWQVQRLAWKNTLIAQIAQAQAEPALGALPQSTVGLDYRKVMLTGEFLYDKALHLIGAPKSGETGFLMLTPFRLEDDGRIILVNRGFSPPGKESRPYGPQHVEGVIRPPRVKRVFFSPDNRPDKNIWFYEDISGIAAATGLKITPLIVEQVNPLSQREREIYPIPGDGKIVLRNDHLQYAITWFSLALIALVMFGFYHKNPDGSASA